MCELIAAAEQSLQRRHVKGGAVEKVYKRQVPVIRGGNVDMEDRVQKRADMVRDFKAGGQTAGGRTAGGRTAGGRTAGDRTAGGRTAGGRTAGGQTAGGRTAGAKPKRQRKAKKKEKPVVAEKLLDQLLEKYGSGQTAGGVVSGDSRCPDETGCRRVEAAVERQDEKTGRACEEGHEGEGAVPRRRLKVREREEHEVLRRLKHYIILWESNIDAHYRE